MMMMMMMDFSHKGGGTRTPLDPLDIDSPILSVCRLSDRGDGAKRYEQKKNSEAYIIIISFTLIFSFFCYKAV